MFAVRSEETATVDPTQESAEAAYRAAIDEEFRRKGVKPIGSVEELRRDDIFETDEELDEFLADLYESRRRRRELARRAGTDA